MVIKIKHVFLLSYGLLIKWYNIHRENFTNIILYGIRGVKKIQITYYFILEMK